MKIVNIHWIIYYYRCLAILLNITQRILYVLYGLVVGYTCQNHQNNACLTNKFLRHFIFFWIYLFVTMVSAHLMVRGEQFSCWWLSRIDVGLWHFGNDYDPLKAILNKRFLWSFTTNTCWRMCLSVNIGEIKFWLVYGVSCNIFHVCSHFV